MGLLLIAVMWIGLIVLSMIFHVDDLEKRVDELEKKTQQQNDGADI